MHLGYAIISRDGVNTDTVNWRHLAPHPGPATPTNDTSPSSETTDHSPEVDLTTSPAAATPAAIQSPNSPAQTNYYQTQRGRISKPSSSFQYGENVENITQH